MNNHECAWQGRYMGSDAHKVLIGKPTWLSKEETGSLYLFIISLRWQQHMVRLF
jgi:hypothetical protein